MFDRKPCIYIIGSLRNPNVPQIGNTVRAAGFEAFDDWHGTGPEADDHTLYASHTIWQSKATFEAWTKSEAFRAAHARAGNETTGSLYLEHPKFEGFEIRQTVQRPEAAVA